MKKLSAILIVLAISSTAFAGTLWSEDFEGTDTLVDRGFTNETAFYTFGTITHADGTTSQGIYGGSGADSNNLDYVYDSAISVVPTDDTVGVESWSWQNTMTEGDGKSDKPFQQINYSDLNADNQATAMTAKHYDGVTDNWFELNPSATVAKWATGLKPYTSGSWDLDNIRGRAVDYEMDIVRRKIDDDTTEFETRMKYAFLDDSDNLVEGVLYQQKQQDHSGSTGYGDYDGYGDSYAVSRIQMKDTDQTIVDGLSKGTTGLTDFDLDGDTDFVGGFGESSDLEILVANVGTGSTLYEGDADNDGDVDYVGGFGETSDLEMLIANVGETSGPQSQMLIANVRGTDLGADASPGTAEMVYDVTTGEVWFDVGSTDVVNVKLQVNPSLLSIDTLAVTSLNGVDPSANDGANLNFLSNSGLPAGEDSVGEILPAGVTMDPGTNVIFQYQVTGQVPINGTITTIPEPMTMSLLAVGGLGVLIRRKRA